MKWPLLYLSFKTLIKRKSSSLLLVFNIAICVSFSLAVVSLINSYSSNYKTQIRNTYGIQHEILFDVPDDLYTSLIEKSDAIENIGKVTIHAIVEIPDSIFNEMAALGEMDDNAAELSRIRLLSGKLPEKSNEIAVEKSTLAKLNAESLIGSEIVLDVLPIPVNGHSNTEPVKQTFVITGIIENYTRIHLPEEMKENGRIDLPSIILADDNILEGLFDKSVKNYYLQYRMDKDSGNPYTHSADIEELEIARHTERNTGLYDSESGREYSWKSGADLLSPLLLILAVLFATFFLLVNNLIYSNNERIKQILSIKYAGAANRDILYISVMKSVILISLGIPSGIIISIPLLYGLKKLFNYLPILNFEYIIDYQGSLIAILLTTLIVFVLIMQPVRRLSRLTTMQIVDSIYGRNIIRQVRFNCKNGVLLWAVKSAVNNLRKVTSVCISFSLIIIIIVGGIYNIRVYKLYRIPRTRFDYKIDISRIGFSLLRIPEKISFGLSDKELFYLKSSADVKRIDAIKKMEINIECSSVEQSNKYGFLFDMSIPSARDIQMYNDDKQKFGYSIDSVIYRTILKGMDDHLLLLLSPYIVSGNIDIDRLKSSDDVILCVDSSVSNLDLEAGDSFVFSQIIDSKLYEKTVSISAVAVLPKDNNDLYDLFGKSFIWHADSFEKALLDVNYGDIRIEVNDPETTDDIRGRLNEINSQYERNARLQISSRIEENEIYRNSGKMAAAIGGILVLLLISYSMINIVNFINMNIKERSRVFGMMRAVGMTKWQLSLLVNIESLYFVTLSSIIGLLICAVIVLFIHNVPRGYSILSIIPFEYIVFTPVALFAAALMAGIIPVRQICRKSITGLISEL